jgi:hypothetical protein
MSQSRWGRVFHNDVKSRVSIIWFTIGQSTIPAYRWYNTSAYNTSAVQYKWGYKCISSVNGLFLLGVLIGVFQSRIQDLSEEEKTC